MSTISFNDVKAKMAQIRSSFDRDVASIRASNAYTDAGRRAELAKTTFSHRKQAEDLRSRLSAANEEARVRLSAKLFGLPFSSDAANVLVYRDACDRSEALKSADDAAAMLKRATEMGDALLARAVAGHAYSKQWTSVAGDYAAATGLTAALDELNEIPSGRMFNLGLKTVCRIPVPQELETFSGEISDERLQAIATGDAA